MAWALDGGGAVRWRVSEDSSTVSARGSSRRRNESMGMNERTRGVFVHVVALSDGLLAAYGHHAASAA